MPIRPENKDRYPADWKAISQAVRDAAGNRCQQCGVENGERIHCGMHCNRRAWRYASDSVFIPSRCTLDGSELPGTSWDDFHLLGTVKVILTVAHLDHTPEHCDPSNLRAWCQRCHNAYDAPMRRQGMRLRAHASLAMAELKLGGDA